MIRRRPTIFPFVNKSSVVAFYSDTCFKMKIHVYPPAKWKLCHLAKQLIVSIYKFKLVIPTPSPLRCVLSLNSTTFAQFGSSPTYIVIVSPEVFTRNSDQESVKTGIPPTL